MKFSKGQQKYNSFLRHNYCPKQYIHQKEKNYGKRTTKRPENY